MSAEPATDPIDVLAQRFEVLGRVLRELRRKGRCPWLEEQLTQVRTALGPEARIPAARKEQARLIAWAFEIAALSCCELARIPPAATGGPQNPPQTNRPATQPVAQRSPG